MSSKILGWAHASVDWFAVLLDLWTCETSLFEEKMPGTEAFLCLKTVICNHFTSSCIRFPFNSISPCVCTQMPKPATMGGGKGFRYWELDAGLGAEDWSCWVLWVGSKGSHVMAFAKRSGHAFVVRQQPMQLLCQWLKALWQGLSEGHPPLGNWEG